MWGELSSGELSLGRDVCNSPRHGLHVNSLLGFGQRYINITRNAIGPKSGQKDCRKF